MARGERKDQTDDADDWEVVDDVEISRPLGTVVSVRFNAMSAAKVRRGASALNVTLSEFVRRAALTAADVPEMLRDDQEPVVSRHVLLVGNRRGSVTGNLIWHGYGTEPVRVGESTVGSTAHHSLIDGAQTGTGG